MPIRTSRTILGQRHTYIVHHNTYHENYFDDKIGSQSRVAFYVDQFSSLLLSAGLTYLEGTNYFYNNKCGVYIFDGSQIVVYLDCGTAYSYDTHNPSAYSLIGFLVVTRLIDLVVNTDNRSDNNDKYEF